jgi:hypothetical protein
MKNLKSADGLKRESTLIVLPGVSVRGQRKSKREKKYVKDRWCNRLRVNHDRRRTEVKCRVQQIDLGKNQDQKDDDQGAAQENDWPALDGPMTHSIDNSRASILHQLL